MAKTAQEKTAWELARQLDLDLRVVCPGTRGAGLAVSLGL